MKRTCSIHYSLEPQIEATFLSHFARVIEDWPTSHNTIRDNYMINHKDYCLLWLEIIIGNYAAGC
jgi:hypothetical protein